MEVESFPEKAGALESSFTLSKEDASCCSHIEGHPEQSCVSASEQGSVPDSGRHLWTESEWVCGEVPLLCSGWVEPVVAPEKFTELPSCPRRMTILPRGCDFAMRAKHPVKQMQFAPTACDENWVDSRSFFCPPGDEDRSQMDAESFWEKVGPLKSIFTLSKEEASISSHVTGLREQSCVLASEQGSMPDSGGHLWAESTERASGAVRAGDVPLLCGGWVKPIVVPKKSAELPSCPCRMTILHRRNFAVKEIQFACTTCEEKCVDSRRQALARSTGKMTQDTLSSSPEVPPEAEKLYSCAWCQEPFKLQLNLDVHYRYCRQRAKQ